MTDTPPTPKPSSSPPQIDAVSPDELMTDFQGHSLVKIVVVTLIAHVALLGAFSPGYLKAQVFGESEEPDEEVAELSDEEKLQKAEKDGKEALREVADRYGITIKELKAQLAAESGAVAADPETPATTGPATPEQPEPGSQIERDLQTEADGPTLPDLSTEGEEDIFAPGTP